MNKYIAYVIEDLRKSTENEEYSDLIGISDNEFLRFLNDGQNRIQALIVQNHPKIFVAQKDYTIAADQESVDLPYDTFLNNKISNVKFKRISYDYSYKRLTPTYMSQIEYDGSGEPCQYLRKSSKIHLYPKSDTAGTLRVEYIQGLPKVDIRRGQVSAVTITSSVITTLELEVATDNPDFDELAKHTRFCLVDNEGNIKAADVRIDSFNSTTGAATINASQLLDTGETIAVGDYIVTGQYSSTHSELDESIERYIMSYATSKIMQQEGSNEIAQEAQTLALLEKEIIDSYADITDDFHEIPVIISEEDDWSF